MKEWKCNNNKQNVESIDSIWRGDWGCHLFGRDANPIAFIRDDKIEWKASKEANDNDNWRRAARLDGCIVDFASTWDYSIGVTSSGRIVASKTTEESPRIEWDALLLPRDVVGLFFSFSIGFEWKERMELNSCLVWIGCCLKFRNEGDESGRSWRWSVFGVG